MRKLLIADDDDAIRRLVRMTLESEYYEIVEVTDGDQVLGAVREHRPDLVLLDVMMPGMSGFDVCRLIKADPEISATSVIMLTAKAQMTDLEEGERAGADGYFTKPFSPTFLLRRVDEVFERRRA